jgi:hypothetical protein
MKCNLETRLWRVRKPFRATKRGEPLARARAQCIED